MPGFPATIDRNAGRDVFGDDPAGYHGARAGYSDALIDRVMSYVADARPRVVEIGPGTGLATRKLLERDVEHVTAVEPDTAMARFLIERCPDPRLQVIEAPFVDAHLPSAAFDLAAAACSFHWVDPKQGLAKIREVVRPGGAVALWWHSYRNLGQDAFFDALAPSLVGMKLPPSETEQGYSYLDERTHRELLMAHRFSRIEYAVFTTERLLDARQMRALYASFSFVKLLEQDVRARLLDRIATLVDTQFGGRAPSFIQSPLHLATV